MLDREIRVRRNFLIGAKINSPVTDLADAGLQLVCYSTMGVKGVCSGCASWVEEGWSYCMHCGAACPVRRSSLTLSTSLYRKHATPAGASQEKRSLRRRRQSSEEVGRQLQQVRMSWNSVLLPCCVKFTSIFYCCIYTYAKKKD